MEGFISFQAVIEVSLKISPFFCVKHGENFKAFQVPRKQHVATIWEDWHLQFFLKGAVYPWDIHGIFGRRHGPVGIFMLDLRGNRPFETTTFREEFTGTGVNTR